MNSKGCEMIYEIISKTSIGNDMNDIVGKKKS